MVNICIQIKRVRVTYVKYLMRYAKEVHSTRDSNVWRISLSTASLERVNNHIVRESKKLFRGVPLEIAAGSIIIMVDNKTGSY